MKSFSVRSLIWLTLLVAMGLAYFLERRARLGLEKDYSSLAAPKVSIVYPLVDEKFAEFISQSVMANLYLPLGSPPLRQPKAIVRFLDSNLAELASGETTQFRDISPHVFSFYVNDDRKTWKGFSAGVQHIRVDVYEREQLIASDIRPVEVVSLKRN